MRCLVPGTPMEFEVPDEWWIEAGMRDFSPISEHYCTDLSVCSEVVTFEELKPPLREGAQFWFRDRKTVVEILAGMRTGEELEPIEVWSRAKSDSNKIVVRDGFHRFYLSIAAGYRKIPVRINDFDLNKFLERERNGQL